MWFATNRKRLEQNSYARDRLRSNFKHVHVKSLRAHAVDRRGYQIRGLPPADDNLGRRAVDRARLCRAAIDDPSRIRRSRDIGAYLGLVPKRYQSGEIDYVGGISKCGDRRVRTLLYEAANVMLTRYKGQLKLKDWAFAIARRSTMGKARIALARRLAIIMHAMLRDGTEFLAA
jgi:transposase